MDAARVRARLTVGALPLPTVLVDGRAVTRGEPDPEGYLLAAHRLGAAPGDCVVVEDAAAGVRAGLAAGMRVVAVTTSHAAEQLAEADVVVSSLRAAQPELLRWTRSPGKAP